MNNLCKDIIFSSFVYSMDLEEIDNKSIIKDIYDLKNNTESVQRTNRGGWQSSLIKNKLETTSFAQLKNKVESAAQFIANIENLPKENYEFNYWVNINEKNNYNVMHSHGDLLFTAVYYPFVPIESNSDLVFVRTDGGAYMSYPGQNLFRINCKTGMLAIFSPYLFHYVEANSASQERISIAFNISVKQNAIN